MSQAYNKNPEAPLLSPQEATAVNYQQLPENIMWLSDGRGFHKRPGSLPFAISKAFTDDLFASVAHSPVNWPVALLAVRTPLTTLQRSESSTSQDVTGETFNDPTTLLVVQWNGLATLQRRAAMFVSQDKVFSRANNGDAADANYYVYQNGTAAALSTVSRSSTVGNVAANVSHTAAPNQWGQQAEPALQLKPEQINKAYYPTSNVYKPWYVYQQKEVLMPNSNPGFRGISSNSERSDAVNLNGNVFVGGGGCTVLHYDGHRSYVAGVEDLTASHPSDLLSLTTAGAGALTGAYQYFLTHVVRLPSGEIIEGNPSNIASYTAAAEDINVNFVDTLARTDIFTKEYRYEAWSFTTGGGTVTSFTVNQTHNLEPGEFLTFFIGGARVVGQIHAVSGSTITLQNALTGVPAATIWFSTGGGLRIYRTKAGGSVFYLRTEMAGPAQSNTPPYTQLVDSAADNTLVTQYADTDFDRSPPPVNVSSMTSHQGRLVVLTNTQNTSENSLAQAAAPSICFTPASSSFYFPAENYVTLTQHEFQNTARGLVSINDTLYVFLNSSIIYISGTLGSDPTYTVNELSPSLGCIESRALLKVGSTIYFRSQEGLTKLDGSQLDSQWSAPIRRYLTPNVKTSLYYWRSKNLLLVALLEPLEEINWQTDLVPGVTFATDYAPSIDAAIGSIYQPYTMYHPGTTPGRTLVYDLVSHRWSIWNIDCFNGAVEIDGDLIIAPPLSDSASDSNFIRLSDKCNWTDSGTPFTARYYTQWYDDGDPGTDKSFHRLGLFSTDTEDAGGQNFEATVRTEKNWQRGLTVDSFTSSDFLDGRGYGELPYGSQPYGDPEMPVKVFPLSGQKVKSMRAVIENSQPNRDFVFNAVEMESADKHTNMKDA